MEGKNEFGVISETGANITDRITEGIAFAAKEKRDIAFEFNDVIITVNEDSDQKLIYRDYLRADKGYIEKDVGPYPKPVLTDKEKTDDARIKAENKREWQKTKAKYEAIIAKNKRDNPK